MSFKPVRAVMFGLAGAEAQVGDAQGSRGRCVYPEGLVLSSLRLPCGEEGASGGERGRAGVKGVPR